MGDESDQERKWREEHAQRLSRHAQRLQRVADELEAVDRERRWREEYAQELKRRADELQAMADAHGGRVPAGELFKLLDRLDREVDEGCTYRGLRSQEVEALRELTDQHWAAIFKKYKKWLKYAEVMRYPTILFLLLLGLTIHQFGGAYDGWAPWIWAAALFGLGHRLGHSKGYEEGYESGHDDGINRALGISDDEAKEIAERAARMELHDLSSREDKATTPDNRGA